MRMQSDWLSHINPICLAPMEGLVDFALRDTLTSIGGLDLCVTEFIRVTDHLLSEKEWHKYAPELQSCSQNGIFTRTGVPLLLQLLGSDPVALAENAVMGAELGAQGIDFNFGCPAKTVNRHDGGATLLKNPERIESILRSTRKALPVGKTLSAKVRLGFSDKTRCIEIALAAEAGGADWLVVHARTRDEGYRPPAHWEFIAMMREALKIPVIANGDIFSPQDHLRCQSVTGCRATMLGRGLIATPDLARQIKFGSKPMTFTELKPYILHFIKLCLIKSDHFALCRLKQWLRFMVGSYSEAAVLFAQVKTQNDLSAAMDIIFTAGRHTGSVAEFVL